MPHGDDNEAAAGRPLEGSPDGRAEGVDGIVEERPAKLAEDGLSSDSVPALMSRPSDLYVGICRAIGTRKSELISLIESELAEYGYNTVQVIKLSQLFTQLKCNCMTLSPQDQLSQFEYFTSRMDFGDHIREVAGPHFAAVLAVASMRQVKQREDNDVRRLFILDSLMHPEEVNFLRETYQHQFVLVGCTDDAQKRFDNLLGEIRLSDRERNSKRFYEIGEYDREHLVEMEHQCDALMRREERDSTWYLPVMGEPPGRSVSRDSRVNVRDTFSLSDMFLNRDHMVVSAETVRRFFGLYFGNPFLTPTVDETGMAHAFIAQRASASLARRVGAAILTEQGELIASGANEVPSPGGGFYRSLDAFPPEMRGSQPTPFRDHEFTYRPPPTPIHRDRGTEGLLNSPGPPESTPEIHSVDPNDIIKVAILEETTREVFGLLESMNLLANLDTVPSVSALTKALLGRETVTDGQGLGIIEYTRSVHAEMHALLACGRRGVSTQFSTLYTTTYPCHECARHIVAAGVSRVVFMEPYPKSRVSALHYDSIDASPYTGPSNRDPNVTTITRVPFLPYEGIAPDRQYSLYSWVPRKVKLSDFALGEAEVPGKAVEWAPSSTADAKEQQSGSHQDGDPAGVKSQMRIAVMDAIESVALQSLYSASHFGFMDGT